MATKSKDRKCVTCGSLCHKRQCLLCYRRKGLKVTARRRQYEKRNKRR